MPDIKTPPADAGAGESSENDEEVGTPDQKPAANTSPKTFTQAELDVLLAEQRRRAVPKDYEELKAKAALADAAAEEKKTELQKAQDVAEKAKSDGKAAIATANATLRRAALLSEASKAGAIDPDTVVAVLADSEDVTVKEGKVEGAKDAVESLKIDKAFLFKAALPGNNGGEFGGRDDMPITQQIVELERKGDKASLAEARQLKAAQMFTR